MLFAMVFSGRVAASYCMMRSLGRFLSLFCLPLTTCGRLEAAAILPHGDFALDPTLLEVGSPARAVAESIHKAAVEVGQWLDLHIDPDLIVLSTPHGITLDIDFGVYLGDTADGYVDLGQDFHNGTSYRRSLGRTLLAPRLTPDLVTALGENVTGIDLPGDMPLRWAEVIPLLLLPRRRRQRLGSAPRRHAIMSHPLRRYQSAPSMVGELQQLGRRLFVWLEARPERSVVIISGDLAHTHQPDGPYGYSPSAAVFDKAVAAWAADPCHQTLEAAADLEPTALSCGFTGLAMLQGLLCEAEWAVRVSAVGNATYYGMMVADYARRAADDMVNA